MYSKKVELQEDTLLLEGELSKDLITNILNHGVPVENILPDILPMAPYTDSRYIKKKVRCNVLRVFIRAIYDGVTSEIALARWLDKDLAENELSSYFGSNLQSDEVPHGLEAELRNKYLKWFKMLREKAVVPEEQYQEILSRAVDLSMRIQIKRRAAVLGNDTTDRSKDIFTSNADYTHESTRILSDSQRGAVVPLAEKYDHLLQYILGDGAGKVPTPFPVLNDLLGGGLANGSKYVVVSPPGGGKTTICTQIADYAAMSGFPVIFVSMEMSMEHIYVNSIARLGEINSAKIMSPYREIKEKTLERVGEIAEEYQQTAAPNIYIVEGNYNTTPARLETMV
ncbi:DnaB-like helicase C-terminal domain-containing protein, partial [Desulfonatronovibrio magnus]|uniref:DnaB-like helicase C-terminal domain-containing protein n=1 Tax=Desulfonatronovibrio magnus TaxID=698827 RepID=UPI002FC31F8E